YVCMMVPCALPFTASLLALSTVYSSPTNKKGIARKQTCSGAEPWVRNHYSTAAPLEGVMQAAAARRDAVPLTRSENAIHRHSKMRGIRHMQGIEYSYLMTSGTN
ncbi:hypothetical protein CLAIMM_07769, partial [Cladophialophora immunda]